MTLLGGSGGDRGGNVAVVAGNGRGSSVGGNITIQGGAEASGLAALSYYQEEPAQAVVKVGWFQYPVVLQLGNLEAVSSFVAGREQLLQVDE